MRRYCSFLVFVAGAFFAACTGVDDTLGQDLIPRDQQMELGVRTVAPFAGFGRGHNDSVVVSGLGRFYLGSRVDPVFGRMSATGMSDFYPVSQSWNDGLFYGVNPVVDSVFLDIYINDIIGEVKPQTFHIYGMTSSPKRDSTYMRGERLEALKGDHLFTFTLDDRYPKGALALIKVDVTPAGWEFVRGLSKVGSDVYAQPWPDFRDKYNGLYFALAPGNPEDAAVYEIVLRGSYSNLTVWFHHDVENDEGVVEPTASYATYSFTDTGWYSDNRIVNLNMMEVKYEGSVFAADRLYVQSMGGVVSYVDVGQDLVDWFAQVKGEGGFSDVVVNQARLEFPVRAPFDLIPTRMGMYYHYGSGEPVPDYDYASENYAATLGQTFTLPYGGYFSTAGGGYYSMIVTEYVKRLQLDPANAPRRIWLGPDVNSRATHYSEAVLDPAGAKLVLTYTLIR